MTDLRERVARACAYAVEKQYSDIQAVKALGFESVEAFVDGAWPNYLPQADAAIALCMEDAARVADAKADEWSTEWRKTRKVDSHLEGKSDGAAVIAAAIRALAATPKE